MKFVPLILLILTATFIGLINQTISEDITNSNYDNVASFSPQFSEVKPEESCSMRFDLSINYDSSKIYVNQIIVVGNSIVDSSNRIFFALPLNALDDYPNNYNKGQLPNESEYCEHNNLAIKVNEIPYQLNYIPHKIFTKDNTLAELTLNQQELNVDSIVINLSYNFNIPVGADRIGFSRGQNLCLLTDWYPYIIKTESEKFHRTQLTKPDQIKTIYEVSIDVPNGIKVISTAEKSKLDTKKEKFFQNHSNELVFVLLNESIDKKYTYNNEKQKIEVDIYMLEQYERYTERIEKAVNHTFDFISENITDYPMDRLSVVNVPNNTNFGFNSYPGIVTVYCDLISPINTNNPEYELIRMLVKQYLLNIKKQDYDNWIDEGLVTFITSEIISRYYKKPYVYFHFAGYYPIYGLNFLSYNYIPIIYTLNNFSYDPILKDISKLYLNQHLDPVYSIRKIDLSQNQYNVAYNIKPAILLKAVADEIGSDKMLKAVNYSFSNYKTDTTFVDLLTEYLYSIKEKESAEFIIKNLKSNLIYDYAIESIEHLYEDSYELQLTRLGNGIADVNVHVFSDSGSSIVHWDGVAKRKKITFQSKEAPQFAQLNLKYAEILDVNIGNNSYTLSTNIIGPLAISIRTFFWFQNALMIFGSIG